MVRRGGRVLGQRTTPLFLTLLLIFFLAVASLMVVFYYFQMQAFVRDQVAQSCQYHGMFRQIIAHYVHELIDDTLYLSLENELQEYVTTGNKVLATEVADEFAALLQSRKLYDQLRFIDATGMERIRVNYNNGRINRVPEDRLQNKANRYYFLESLSLRKGEISLTSLDLNVEHGKVERPYKPTIRAATPLFHPDGRPAGILMVNALAEQLLHDLKYHVQQEHIIPMVLTIEGYYLLGMHAGDAWGWQLPGGTERRFTKRYPRQWQQMQARKSGHFIGREGLFCFTWIEPFTADEHQGPMMATCLQQVKNPAPGNYEWLLVTMVPPRILAEQRLQLLQKLSLFFVVTLILSGLLSWYLAFSYVRHLDDQEQLRKMALQDPLTGLPNRRLFFDRLNAALKHAGRFGRKCALLYIDLDGFKQVNDQWGHKAGDELLKQVAYRLLSTCRKSDTIARLGGDEFACVLFEVQDLAGANVAAENLISELNRPFQLTAGQVEISASIGVALYPEHGSYPEILVALADNAMYMAKKQGKNRCEMCTP